MNQTPLQDQFLQEQESYNFPTDMGMPFGYPRISISGSAHYEGGLAQGLEDWLGDEEGSNPYSTRTLVNLSLVAYLKPGRGAPRETTKHIIDILQTTDLRLDRN
jgi:hypothetical protein